MVKGRCVEVCGSNSLSLPFCFGGICDGGDMAAKRFSAECSAM